MATGWESFPLTFTGGLIGNLSRLQQGLRAPGSARYLVNFEPSTKGGYRRINGYNKHNDNKVPSFGSSKVQGNGYSGNTLVIGNLAVEPTTQDSFTIDGVTGTYTISAVSYSLTSKEATLTLNETLPTSPDDKADITWTDNPNSKIEGLYYHYDTVNNDTDTIAIRDGAIWKAGANVPWTDVSAPNYGTVAVNGASQTGTSLSVDGISSDTYVPKAGDTFTIAGVEKVYVVQTDATVTSGATTLSIQPALTNSPADGVAVTFLSSSLAGANRVRFKSYNFAGEEKFVFVDGRTAPKTYGNTSGLTVIDGSPDVVGATQVVDFRSHMFYAKGDDLIFSAPLNENDFQPGNGAGSIRLPYAITGLIVFREKLIIFTRRSIHQLSGSSFADFVLSDISNDLGCLREDTVAEVGGDIMFLGPDGLRLLGATARIGDFELAAVSRVIQDELAAFTSSYTNNCSVTIRSKSQYRLFGYRDSDTPAAATGYIAFQRAAPEGGTSFEWSRLEGIKAYRATSVYTQDDEVVLFSSDTGYVYRLDVGSTFDGSTIDASFYTPFVPLNDPTIRKTLHKITTFYDPEGTVAGVVTPKYDFRSSEKIQPDSQPLEGGDDATLYGTAFYGQPQALYGDLADTVIEVNTTGSFFTVSLEYSFTEPNVEPFTLDTSILEFTINDRK